MTSPFSAPPEDTVGVVRPNRHPRPSTARTVVVWLVLVVMFVAIYRVMGSSPSRAPEPPRIAPAAGGTPFGWAVPALVYGGMVLGLWRWRRRLPAAYRTGERREIAREVPSPEPDPAPIDVTVDGDSGGRRIHLRIDGGGLYWLADKTVLTTAQELRIAWSELEGFSITPAQRNVVLLWIAGGLLGAAALDARLRLGLAVLGAVFAAAWALGRWRAQGILSLTTATHALTLQSRAIDAALASTLTAAVRARAPRAIPAAGARQQSALVALFAEPFLQLTRLTWSDARVSADLHRGARDLDPEAARAGIVQWRMFSLWSGVLRGGGPLAVAVGAALALGPVAAIMPAVVAWVAGLIATIRLLPAFARFSGMSVVR